MLTAVLAFFIDCILGDPRSRFHPVVLMGNLIAWLEHCFYRPEDTNEKKLLCGGMLALIVLVVCYEAAWCILRLLGLIPLPNVGMALEALLLAFMISPKSLAAAGMEIRALLKAGDLPEARRKVGWIVGRDTEKLSVPEVSRAAIETVAENTVDGVLAPLFFYLIGGLPFAVLYRAANTMDSMLGYKNAKYLYFGRVAARLDDVLNYIPARIAGVLFVLAAFFLGFDGRGAWRLLHRDAAKHPSPNGGRARNTLGRQQLLLWRAAFSRLYGRGAARNRGRRHTEDRAPHVYGHDSFSALDVWRVPSLAAEGDAFLV